MPATVAFESPLRVDLMDAESRRNVRAYIQSRLLSYHEDENGNPTFPPGHAHSDGAAATPTPGSPVVHTPARGIVTMRSGVDARNNTGMRALCTVFAQGARALNLWGGDDFDTKLLTIPLASLSVSVVEDTAHDNMFALSCASSGDAPVPSVYCFVRDRPVRDKWLAIFRRRGVNIG